MTEKTSGGEPIESADAPDCERIVESFDGVETHEELLARSEAYCERAVDEYGFDVDLDPVDWEVSTRAKRRAAAVKRPRLPDAEVGRPIDWAALDDAAGASASNGESIERCTVSLTWAAFREFAAAEWAATLRHELIHVEQFQAFGTTDHGRRFKRRAAELDTSVRCRSFGTPKYRLLCGECGDTVARRYRECKLVRNHRSYVSGCCGEVLECERPEA